MRKHSQPVFVFFALGCGANRSARSGFASTPPGPSDCEQRTLRAVAGTRWMSATRVGSTARKTLSTREKRRPRSDTTARRNGGVQAHARDEFDGEDNCCAQGGPGAVRMVRERPRHLCRPAGQTSGPRKRPKDHSLSQVTPDGKILMRVTAAPGKTVAEANSNRGTLLGT